jgi:hypothetical protein
MGDHEVVPPQVDGERLITAYRGHYPEDDDRGDGGGCADDHRDEPRDVGALVRRLHDDIFAGAAAGTFRLTCGTFFDENPARL